MPKRTPDEIRQINIRPGVSVLSVLSHLNYRSWFALAEFVDNAVQSHSSARDALLKIDPAASPLRVDIEIDQAERGRIIVRDNAAGIAQQDFPRAFRPAELPPDRSGLCEFGMGMKSAACWFSPKWQVRTSALGEPVERSVAFDIEQIVRDSVDELAVASRPCRPEDHFTEIVLSDLHHIPVGKTIAKIKSHLKDIYRIFVREGMLVLRVNGESLVYEPPETLVAPHFRDLEGEPITWRKDFDFDFGDGLRAHGFAAIRKRASTSQAGFALFRRNRLIQGSADEGYRPEFIFGKPNTFPYQRVFGEIHLEGFGVSHTKDGFQWDENELPFLELLRDEMTTEAMPLLQQAREYRVERAARDYRRGAEQATQRTSETIRDHVPPVMDELRSGAEAPPIDESLPEAEIVSHRVIDLDLHGQPWRIVLELSTDPAVGDWLEITDGVLTEEDEEGAVNQRLIGMRLSLIHPFMQRFCGTDCEEIEPILRIAAAIGLGEIAARDGGVRQAGAVRRNINELLRSCALSHVIYALRVFMSNDNQPDPEEIRIIPDVIGDWRPAVGRETMDLLGHLGLPPETAANVRDEAAAIIARCIAPTDAGGQDTGLVVGYVQSGKTMSFTTVATLARDNQFAMVIVIAGTSNPLTEQSRERLRRDLRLDHRADRSWRHLHEPRVSQQDHTRIRTTLADWRDPHVPTEERPTILITVKKNYQILSHLIDVLRQVNLNGLPVLIVDDEADQAGLNNLINAGEESTTYERLCTLKRMVPHHTFLQYTATPQGPLLINLIDVLSPGFALTLTPGPDYTGGREFFLGDEPLIRIIPTQEIPSTSNQIAEPPDSLLEAMRLFFLGVAAGIVADSGRGNRSMMVHPTQRTGGHGQYFGWVSAIRGAWQQTLESGDQADRDDLLQDFRHAYDDLAVTVDDLPPFDDLAHRLVHAIRRTELWLVNAVGGRTPQIDWRSSYAHILVGGQALDRGFTVEGLTVTYMPRGVGTRMADTVQQRARFFGYKRPYLGYCRVFLEQAVADAFTRYVQHEEDIRDQISEVAREGRSLDDLRRTFLLPRGLAATRDSIIDVDYVRARVTNGWFTPRAPHESPQDGAANREVANTYLASLDMVEDEGHEARTEIQRHNVAEGVPLADAYDQLLLGLRFSRLTDAQNLLGVLVILRNYLRTNPDATCSVYEMSSGVLRERTLSETGEIPNLFQGEAPVHPRERRGEVYPGDRNIHHPQDVSIQIHRLSILRHETHELAFDDIATIAVWVPDGLAGDVLIQEQGGADNPDA